MKNKINGYPCFDIIKNYQKLNNNINVNYLDGSSKEYNLEDENKILLIMEKQALIYIKEDKNISDRFIRLVSGSSGLTVLLIGTLNWLKVKSTNIPLSNDELILISSVGSLGIGSEIMLIRKLLFKLSYTMGIIDDKEKYNYYLKNKEIFDDCISINDLDNYSLSYLKNMTKEENQSQSKTKILKRKR